MTEQRDRETPKSWQYTFVFETCECQCKGSVTILFDQSSPFLIHLARPHDTSDYVNMTKIFACEEAYEPVRPI